MEATMHQVPDLLAMLFMGITLLTGVLFVWACHRDLATIVALGMWALATAILAGTGFFLRTDVIPPRFVWAIGPPLLAILLLFVLPAGRRRLNDLDVARLTLLHVVRLPVELVLFALFTHKAVPELMTFTGGNWDILSGITAVPVWYLGHHRRVLPRAILITWNLVCLGLLFHIVVNAVLAAPFPFQQHAFDQPNVAVLFFPYIWLPALVVPLVLCAHLVALRALLRTRSASA
jgi:hypothetical protein